MPTTQTIQISGRSKRLIEAIKELWNISLVFTKPTVNSADIQISIVTTKNGADSVTENAGMIRQSDHESMLKPSGGAAGAAVTAAVLAQTATLKAALVAIYDTMQIASNAATGAGEKAAELAATAAGQVTLEAAIDAAIVAINAAAVPV